MFERRVSALLESSLVRVYDVCLRVARSGYGPVGRSDVAQIIAPRRGVLGVERRGEDFIVDTGSVFVVAADDECRVRHPGHDGDDCTVVLPPPELLEEWTTGVDAQLGRLRPRDQFAVCLITNALRDPVAAQIEAEDAAVLLLTVLARAFHDGAWSNTKLSAARRARVERVRALLADAPATRWDLAAVARAVNCSPFHLARDFRVATGETLSRYLLGLRLGLALQRLADGETNLSALALATGFAHHSHFSARFRAVFGLTPKDAREMLTRPRLDQLRDARVRTISSSRTQVTPSSFET